MKKLKKDEDQINALKMVANVLSLDEISRMTGVRLELLRRFINRTANDAKAETWDKVYPVIKPYLTGQEDVPPPKRIGPGYRRHAEIKSFHLLIFFFSCFLLQNHRSFPI